MAAKHTINIILINICTSDNKIKFIYVGMFLTQIIHLYRRQFKNTYSSIIRFREGNCYCSNYGSR